MVRWRPALIGSLAAALLTLLAAATPAAAGEAVSTYLNGRELYFDVAPVVQNGRVLVPARGYLEAMGARLTWDGVRQRVTVYAPGHVVTMTIDQPYAHVNGLPVALGVPPTLLSGRTLVPLRFLSEALSATVAYDAAVQRVDVTYVRPGLAARSGTEGARARDGGAATGDGGAAAGEEPAPAEQVWVMDGPLNVRAGPGTDHAVLTTVPTGTRLRLVAAGSDWVQVGLDDGRAGWVARPYVSLHRTDEDPGPLAARLVSLGLDLVGAPYIWGGDTPAGFDCSGFLQYIFAQVGVALPRATEEQAAAGVAVTGDLRPGDILAFATYTPGPSHTALYIGNGRFVHAQSEAVGVTVTALDNPYWAARYLGARRVLE